MSTRADNHNVLAARLTEALGADAVLTGEAVHGRSGGLWGGPDRIAARILVRPTDTHSVARCLSICNESGQPVVTHGGLTGTVQGALTDAGDVVLSMERMRAIERVDELQRVMICEAGVPLEKAQQAARDHDLMFPLDLGARGSATVGGNAATNAGGNQVLRFGMMRNQVLGLEAVLADGTIVSSMNQMLKNNAGYDVKQLFIGTEGTLGVITRLVLRLLPQPASQDTAFVAVDDFTALSRLLAELDGGLGGHLTCFEVLWNDYYEFITGDGRHTPPVARGHAYYALVESWGSEPAADAQRFESVLGEAMVKGLIQDAVIAKSRAERDALWLIRDDVVQLLDIKPMFLFDVSLPLRDMETYVAGVRAQLTERWPDARLYTFGHLGDGNLHFAISAGPADESARDVVEEIVYRPLGRIGGSISGEHGIGLEKKPYLGWCRNDAELAIMRSLKASLDPNGILNPGKVF